MRLSRVLLAGAAVAGAVATTSAFTAGNDFTGVDNNVAGYGQLAVTGVAVSNIAYNPAALDASKLHSVVFTVDKDTTSMSAIMTLYKVGTPDTVPAGSASTCAYTGDGGATHTITCTLAPADVAFTAFDKTALTVTSN